MVDLYINLRLTQELYVIFVHVITEQSNTKYSIIIQYNKYIILQSKGLASGEASL